MIQPVQEDNKGGFLLEVYYYLGKKSTNLGHAII
jgi:hypothetical protein